MRSGSDGPGAIRDDGPTYDHLGYEPNELPDCPPFKAASADA